jgi:hypothetical protein
MISSTSLPRKLCFASTAASLLTSSFSWQWHIPKHSMLTFQIHLSLLNQTGVPGAEINPKGIGKMNEQNLPDPSKKAE